jgi:hypothetical protein
MATRYRDHLTGRLVSKSTWRSNASKRYGGGKRYTKEKYDWHAERDKSDGIVIRVGYAGRDNNSYTLVVRSSVYPGETDADVANRIEKETSVGTFNNQHYRVKDLRWATFHNAYSIEERLQLRKDTLELVTFLREEP